MALPGRTEGRLALAILLTAVIPLIVSIYFANTLVERAFAQAFTPELGEHLDKTLGLYQDLARALKDSLRYQGDAIASRSSLRLAAETGQTAAIVPELDALFSLYPSLAMASVTDRDGNVVSSRDRGTPLDASQELALEVRRPLGDTPTQRELLAIFATPRRHFAELGRASEFVQAYHHIENARFKLKRGDLYAFAAILAATILVSTTLGILTARSVTRRLQALAVATHAVAQGDLGIRVPEEGKDELTELSRSFNRMLAEVENNRARIEYLQRISAWQEMARRLAHEIKNPLTPILLAVEECHRKYEGDDPRFRSLLNTTLEIVEEEVGTLRRLVSEFSSFARLPRAELERSDLAEFLREQKCRLPIELLEDEKAGLAHSVELSWDIPEHPMPIRMDKQMLRQVLVNVLRNASQAVVGHKGRGHIAVRLETETDWHAIFIDDDGPGVAETMRASIFDPYVTTKSEGTGLGLAIVKKIVVEHGGSIEVGKSDLGGASFRIRLPKASPHTLLATSILPSSPRISLHR